MSAGHYRPVVAAALIFQQLHDLRGTVMTVATHRDLDPWPVMPDAADNVAQHPSRLRTGRLFART